MSSYWENASELQSRLAAPKEFLEANGFTRATHYRNYTDVPKTLKSGTFSSFGIRFKEEMLIPCLDHAHFYKNPKTKVCCLVTMPYGTIEHLGDTMLKWVESNGLKADVYDKSWYDTTNLVIIHTPDTEIIVPDSVFSYAKT